MYGQCDECEERREIAQGALDLAKECIEDSHRLNNQLLLWRLVALALFFVATMMPTFLKEALGWHP